METKELRELLEREDHALSYARPWPVSYKTAYDAIPALLDEIDRLDELATQSRAFCESLAKSLARANTKVSELLDEGDRLREKLRITENVVEMQHEDIEGLRARCEAAEADLKHTHYCGVWRGPQQKREEQ